MESPYYEMTHDFEEENRLFQSGYVKGYHDAIMKKSTAWIKCSDKLPAEKDGVVLISMPDGEVLTGRYSEFSERWYKGDMCGVGGADPAAWMPLPEPYKGEY